MSDITLSSGIRQNLLSLQQTSADLTTTQEALATGKSVNSAAANPSAYFTSQNLTNDANSLSSLLDSIGQGLQTIDAADNGLSSITSLLQQALSTVEQAQSDSWTTAATTTGTAELGSFVGGSTTGTSTAALTAANTLSIDVGSSSYSVALTSGETISQVAAAINGTAGLSGAVTASTNSAGDLVVTALSGTSSFSVAADSALGISATTATSSYSNTGATSLSAGNLLIAVGSTTYSVSVASGSSLSQIEADINNTSGLGSSGAVTATDDGNGHLVLTSTSAPTSFSVVANSTSAALGVTTDSSTNNTPIGSSTTRTTLQENYNELLTQISEMAADSGYNGVNLLGGDNLSIDFNQTGSSALTIQGVNYNAEGLGLSSISGATSGSFQDNSELSSLVTNLNSALSTVQSQTETFGTNSSTISTRQTFTTAMINTLQTGASNLTAADQNQESADLLTEQTQQQLEISALSIANQANQSVLKLFG